MRAILTGLIALAFVFTLSTDSSAQRPDQSQNKLSSAAQNRSSMIGVSVDPTSDTPPRVRTNPMRSSDSANKGRIGSIALDPSDSSRNTVSARGQKVRVKRDIAPSRSLIGVQAQMGQQQSTYTFTSNVVQGNYIGTNRRSRIGPEIHGN